MEMAFPSGVRVCLWVLGPCAEWTELGVLKVMHLLLVQHLHNKEYIRWDKKI
jgi:hypothetical protein